MSNKSYSALITTKSEHEALRAYIEKMSAIGNISSYAVTDEVVFVEGDDFDALPLPKHSVLVNITIDRANLIGSFVEEGFNELSHLKIFELEGFECEEIEIADAELKAMHEEFKDTWDYKTFKERYGYYFAIQDATYYDNEQDVQKYLK